VQLADVARQASSRCQGRAPQPKCGSILEEVWVEADPERLTMIVEHVIRNAQDATPAGGYVRVEVGFEGGAGTGEVVDTTRLRVPAAVLTVTDNGAGMTRQFVQDRLFKPFDTTKGSKGMGIGAYQVKEYVQSIGGRIEVISSVGRGTVFALRLPLTTAPENASGPGVATDAGRAATSGTE
jgi:signal transduction histidine kinase